MFRLESRVVLILGEFRSWHNVADRDVKFPHSRSS